MNTLLHYRSAFVTRVRQLWGEGHLHWAAWIFCLAFVIRIAWLFYVNPDPFDGEYFSRGYYDAIFFYKAAESLAAGEGYREPDFLQLSAAWPPGYPITLMILFVIFGTNLVVAKLFNVFLAGIGAVLIYTLATMIRGQRAGIVAGILMAFFPSQIFFSVMVLTEPLFVVLSTTLVLLASRRRRYTRTYF